MNKIISQFNVTNNTLPHQSTVALNYMNTNVVYFFFKHRFNFAQYTPPKSQIHVKTSRVTS